MNFAAAVSKSASARRYTDYTGTWPTSYRSGERRTRVPAAPARFLFSLRDAKDARLLSSKKPSSDDNTGSSDSQEHQDLQGHTRTGPHSDVPWSLPVDEFIVYAAREQLGVAEEDRWNSALWTLTRLVKGRFEEGVTTDPAFKEVDRVIRKHGGWEKCFHLGDDEAYMEFSSAWKKIRFRPGEGPLGQAAAKAKKHPIAAPGSKERERKMPGYDRFVSLVGWLQFTVGDKPIFLPVREIASVLETDIRMVSLWRQLAVEEGLMELVAKHSFRTGGRNKASEFRVKGWLADWFKKHMAERMG